MTISHTLGTRIAIPAVRGFAPMFTPLDPFVWLKAVWERRRVQRLSRDQLIAEQSAKFRRLVRLAYEVAVLPGDH
jgi:hypothetical protein